MITSKLITGINPGKDIPVETKKVTTTHRGISTPTYKNITPITFKQQLVRKGILTDADLSLTPEEINNKIKLAYKVEEGNPLPYQVSTDEKKNIVYQKDMGRSTGEYYDKEKEGKVISTYNKAREGYVDGGSIGSIAPDIANIIAELGGSIIDKKKQSVINDYTSNENPLETLETTQKLDAGKSIMSGTLKGAGIGTMIAPGIGTAIGAGAGALVSGIGSLIGKKDRDKSNQNIVNNWSSNWTQKQAAYQEANSYKCGGKVKKAEGGIIEGKGTGKSDSINMNAESGAFIVPVENAEKATQLGQEYLGWNSKTMAKRNTGDKKIKVSDGEVYFSPEEVGALEYYGVDLNSLAPNAKKEKQGTPIKVPAKKADGGYIGSEFRKDPKYKDYIYSNDDKGNILYQSPMGEKGTVTNEDAIKEYNDYISSLNKPMKMKDAIIPQTKINPTIKNPNDPYFSPFNIEKRAKELSKGKEEGTEKSWLDYVPELAGTIQTLGGAYGLMTAGKKPDLTISKTLQNLSSETKRLAQYGYDPKVLNELNNSIELTRKDLSRSLSESGGSPMEKMAQLNQILSTTIDKKAGITYANAQEKARKWADNMKVQSDIAGQEFDINKIKIEDWYKNQEMFSELLSSGISNIIGARKLKTEQDIMKSINKNPTFSK
jgi:hypothetical protein